MNVRPKIPSLRIDGLILLFDSKRECRLHRAIQSCQAKGRSGRSLISIPMPALKRISRHGQVVGQVAKPRPRRYTKETPETKAFVIFCGLGGSGFCGLRRETDPLPAAKPMWDTTQISKNHGGHALESGENPA